MNILIILILYENLDSNGESINFDRLLQTEKIKLEEFNKFIDENKINNIIWNNETLIIKTTTYSY